MNDVTIKSLDSNPQRFELSLVKSDGRWAGHVAFVWVDNTIEYVAKGGVKYREEIKSLRAIQFRRQDAEFMMRLCFKSSDCDEIASLSDAQFEEIKSVLSRHGVPVEEKE